MEKQITARDIAGGGYELINNKWVPIQRTGQDPYVSNATGLSQYNPQDLSVIDNAYTIPSVDLPYSNLNGNYSGMGKAPNDVGSTVRDDFSLAGFNPANIDSGNTNLGITKQFGDSYILGDGLAKSYTTPETMNTSFADAKTNPVGFSASMTDTKTPDVKDPNSFSNTLGAINTGVGLFSGLAGAYFANKNFKLQKDRDAYNIGRDRLADTRTSKFEQNAVG